MSALAAALLILLLVATGSFYIAGGMTASSPWARDVCGFWPDLCDHPAYSAIATGTVAVVYLALRSLKL
jgi:hypothetical protein